MDEQIEKIANGLSEDALKELDKLYEEGTIPSGMAFIGMLLNLPDEDFNLMRPVVQDAFVESYNDPQVQLQMIQALAQSGISLDDVLNHTDELLEAFVGEQVQLSETKKDLFCRPFVMRLRFPRLTQRIKQ